MSSGVLPAVAVVFAAAGYGSYYVPVKKYDVHDGLVYQWFLCTGIIIGALTGAVVLNDWSAKGLSSSAFYVAPEGVLSGFTWSVANVMATRAVQYFGMANYYLWHELSNLGGTFVIGVWGPQLGIPARTPSNVGLAALGFVLVFLGMVPVAFMESEQPHEPQQEGETSASGQHSLEELFMQDAGASNLHPSTPATGASTPVATRSGSQLALPGQRGAENSLVPEALREENALTWDGTLGRPEHLQLRRLRFPMQPLVPMFDRMCCSGGLAVLPEHIGEEEAAQQEQGGAQISSWLKGWALSLVVGLILSMQYMPMLPWEHRLQLDGFKVSGLEYAFANCLGIFLFSTAYMLVAGGLKRINRQPMQKPVLRPALFAGFLWTMSSYCQLYAMVMIPYAVAYCTIVGGGLAVSLVWSVLAFGEAKTTRNRMCLAASFLGIFVGISVLGLAA